jgi:hypothetical protein
MDLIVGGNLAEARAAGEVLRCRSVRATKLQGRSTEARDYAGGVEGY